MFQVFSIIFDLQFQMKNICYIFSKMIQLNT